jgi:hypothetical protein
MDKAKKGKVQTKGAAAILEDLSQELKHLRTLVREAGEQFIMRQEGEIETIISHLENIPPGVLRKEGAAWLLNLRQLKLKPAKGRIKDLKVVHDLVEVLTEQVIAAQDRPKVTGKGKKIGARD